jgi:hypothetical protein
MNEGDVDFVVPERMAHLSEVVSILLMELESLKTEEKSATVTRDESAQKVRGVELVLQSFEAQLQAFEASLPSGSRTIKDDAKKDVILDMLQEHRDQLKKLQDESARIESELQQVLTNLDLKQTQLAAMTEELSRLKRGGCPSGLQPWPLIYPDNRPGGPVLQYVHVTICSLCGFEFPNFDIVVASCVHLYHPWCALVVFGKGSGRCVKSNCGGYPHPDWFKSFGWGVPNEFIQEKAQLLGCQMEGTRLLAAREEKAKANCLTVGKSLCVHSVCIWGIIL